MMMWPYGNGMMGGYGFGFYGVLSLATWVLVVAVLVALLRWLWKKGDGK